MYRVTRDGYAYFEEYERTARGRRARARLVSDSTSGRNVRPESSLDSATLGRRMPITRDVTPGPFGVIDVAHQARQDLITFVDICWAGVGYAGNAKRLSASLRRAHASLGEPDPPQSPEEIEKENKLEEFVETHCKVGFPYLYCLAGCGKSVFDP